MRYFLIALTLLFSVAAQAQNCISLDPGWTQTYGVGSIQYIGYNISTLNMVVTFRTSPTTNRAFQGVPSTIANKAYNLTNADSFFKSTISTYPEALLTTLQSNFCPLLTQTSSWILTHPVTSPPSTTYLLSDSGIYLDSDSGSRLTKG